MTNKKCTEPCYACQNGLPHKPKYMTIKFTDHDTDDKVYADDNGKRTIWYDLAAKFTSFDDAIDFSKRHNLKEWEV